MAGIRKLPVGIQSFEDLRRNEYLYVDKTKYVWNLVQTGKVYFLSRPRRFGKSLLVSTLEAYFEGKKDLFRGLYIEKQEDKKEKDAWADYPVIKFSLSGGDYHAANGLADRLQDVINSCAEKYDLGSEYAIRGETLPVRFHSLIEQIFRKIGKQVVVLVDEYDKPLLETMLTNEAQEEKNRRLYKSFFSILKDEDQYLKFVFFTGVTKFSKVSIFSDLNQLRDISLSDAYSGICGITEKELLLNFRPEIRAVAEKRKMTDADCIHNLAEMYDGYHFSPEGIGVYNPFSLLSAFQDKRLRRYWFETATPEFIFRKLENSYFTPEQLTDGIEAAESNLTDYRTDNPDPIPLFYQTGYLTIKGFDEEFQIYELGFPNNEVKYGFLNSLVPYVIGGKDAESPLSLRNMALDLREGNLESFMARLESLFAAIPYPEGTVLQYEQEWRNQIFLIFALLGQNVKCEVHSARGRADCIVETKRDIYIFEFKLDKPAEEGLRQIEAKGYALPYKADPRTVRKIGVNFSTEKRNISEWKALISRDRNGQSEWPQAGKIPGAPAVRHSGDGLQ